MWKLMVTGARDWSDRDAINRAMAQCWLDAGSPAECTLIHGGAKGADTIAASIAAEHGWVVHVFPADWDGLGKKAGPMRNSEMLESGRPDHVVGCLVLGSIGTHHALRHSQILGIPRTVIFG